MIDTEAWGKKCDNETLVQGTKSEPGDVSTRKLFAAQGRGPALEPQHSPKAEHGDPYF